MRVRTKILIGIGIVALIAIGFFVIFPYFLVCPPLPLFSIENRDGNNEHGVVVEIFDSDNQSIFKKTVVLGPKEEICYPKPYWLKLTWSRGEYTFKVTVDDTITETCKTEVYPWLEVLIYLYTKDPLSGEISPITIARVVV